jgi:uncharacterized protein
MLTLTQINIYPVKSLDGYSPSSAKVEEKGLVYDRRWMIVDESGMFFTQRTLRKMTHLRARIENEQLIIEEKNNLNNRISISIHQEQTEMTVTVWDDTVIGRLVSSEVDDFLSLFLEKKCHLVKMPISTLRRVEENHNTGNDVVSFADGYPFLIIGESSIRDLNARLTTPLNEENQELVGLRRFRANFIFKGGKPYEEESWKYFNIGNVAFQGIKPCGRCVMTTLDPDTGEKGKEPLALLSEYRKVGNKILFGQNLILNPQSKNNSDEIKVGDEIHL